MTDFLDQLETDLRDAAERRGQPHRRRPTGALKAGAVMAALALLAVGATRFVDRESSDRVAAEETPTATPTPAPGGVGPIAVATAGDPAFLDLLAAPLGAAVRLAASSDGRPSTADPSLGTVVLYRPGDEETAQLVGYYATIDRVAPLTADDEGLIDSNLRDADVVVVFGIDDQERLLRDRNICAPAGPVADEPLTLCVARSDEARFSRFVLDSRALPIGPISENGWWSWGAAAPDGRTILAQWTHYTSYLSATGNCRVPQSALIPADGGQAQPMSTGPAVPLGWTTDGRAIVFRPAGSSSGCGSGDPGVYLVTPDGEATLLEPTDRDEPPPGLEPSIEPRTMQEVTRAAAP
ncbi:MAG TPA: hypothetical protein VFP78_19700 [Solirubrobacteraceae bacterium]|nr:hypothetical protein [Solirubrobacteraceae bacterium]